MYNPRLLLFVAFTISALLYSCTVEDHDMIKPSKPATNNPVVYTGTITANMNDSNVVLNYPKGQLIADSLKITGYNIYGLNLFVDDFLNTGLGSYSPEGYCYRQIHHQLPVISTYYIDSGNVTFTQIDTTNKMVSGTFYFEAVCNETSFHDTLVVTNGVFTDISYK